MTDDERCSPRARLRLRILLSVLLPCVPLAAFAAVLGACGAFPATSGPAAASSPPPPPSPGGSRETR